MNPIQLRSKKSLLLPLSLSPESQLFLINSIWEEHNDDIADDSTLEIKKESEFGNLDLETSVQYQVINSETPLPEFSDLVCSHIEKDKLTDVWGAFVDECAKYYFTAFPSIQNSSEYQAIGRKMYKKYPSIENKGKEPWSYFCKCLSQKIRHIKWKTKRKSLGLTSSRRKRSKGLSHVKNRSKVKHHVDHRYTLSKQYIALLRELERGWSVKSISEKRIKEILKMTFKGRRTWLNTNSTGKLSPLFDSYPCFVLGKYVVHDFLLMTEKENTLEMCQRLESLFSAVGSIMKPSLYNSGLLETINILQYIEEQTSFSQHKGSLWKSIIVHRMNIPDDEIMECIDTDQNSSPQLFVFSDELNITKAFVGGDQKLIDTEATTLFDALIVLIATYYTFSIEFPKYFSQILGVLKTFVVGDSYDGIKSNKYTTFTKKITKDCLLGDEL